MSGLYRHCGSIVIASSPVGYSIPFRLAIRRTVVGCHGPSEYPARRPGGSTSRSSAFAILRQPAPSARMRRIIGRHFASCAVTASATARCEASRPLRIAAVFWQRLPRACHYRHGCSPLFTADQYQGASSEPGPSRRTSVTLVPPVDSLTVTRFRNPPSKKSRTMRLVRCTCMIGPPTVDSLCLTSLSVVKRIQNFPLAVVRTHP